MNKFRITLLISFSIFFFSSCYSGLTIPREERNWEIMKAPEAINGVYSNNSTDPNNDQSQFWLHLKPFFKNQITLQFQQENPDLSVEIEIIAKNNIQFSLLKGKDIIDSKNFKYDIVDKQIRIKKNANLKGIPLLFYRHHKEVILLSLNKENNLIISFEGEASGGIFILAYGQKLGGKLIFEKL